MCPWRFLYVSQDAGASPSRSAKVDEWQLLLVEQTRIDPLTFAYRRTLTINISLSQLAPRFIARSTKIGNQPNQLSGPGREGDDAPKGERRCHARSLVRDGRLGILLGGPPFKSTNGRVANSMPRVAYPKVSLMKRRPAVDLRPAAWKHIGRSGGKRPNRMFPVRFAANSERGPRS